jgi:hypothetical protein
VTLFSTDVVHVGTGEENPPTTMTRAEEVKEWKVKEWKVDGDVHEVRSSYLQLFFFES